MVSDVKHKMLQMKQSWMSTSIQMLLCNPHPPRWHLQHESQSRSKQREMKISFIKWKSHWTTNHLWRYGWSSHNLLKSRCYWEIDGSYRPEIVSGQRQSLAEGCQWNCTDKNTLSETVQQSVEDEHLKLIICIYAAAAISNYHDHNGGIDGSKVKQCSNQFLARWEMGNNDETRVKYNKSAQNL